MFFLYFYFSSFAYICQDITMPWPAVLILEAAGHALSLKPLTIFQKKKNFFQIKIVKMQIDRYGPQKCCKLNRLKISQKLRLLWLFKVRRIMLKKILKSSRVSNYDKICNCCRRNDWLSILDRKLWIEQSYIQKIWKTFGLQQVRVILVQSISKWPLKLVTSNGHCIFHRAWKNDWKTILESY